MKDNSKSCLKNVYNISFYDEKTQINFRGIFYEKIFAIDAKQNDFIEINLKMLLEYENINEKNYVNTIYEILDENNNSLYNATINNNDYQYFSNKVSIKENIFYNFTKNVKNMKFRIKFVMTAAKVIKIWYIPNNNYRFILKHYSLKPYGNEFILSIQYRLLSNGFKAILLILSRYIFGLFN